MKVWALPNVIEELENLIDILYEKEYFIYKDSAVEYVVTLFEDIIKNLPTRVKRLAPKYFTDQYRKGLYYAVFPKSKRTQWYVFFKIYQKDGKLYYQVYYIANNHIIAQHLTY